MTFDLSFRIVHLVISPVQDTVKIRQLPSEAIVCIFYVLIPVWYFRGVVSFMFSHPFVSSDRKLSELAKDRRVLALFAPDQVSLIDSHQAVPRARERERERERK